MVRLALSVCALLAAHPLARGDDAAKTFGDRVRPILDNHCVSCHSGDTAKAKLDLTKNQTAEQLKSDGLHWFRLLERIEDGSMPPPGKPRLSAGDRKTVSGWVNGDLTDLLTAAQLKDGRSKLRRLSRTEYANTVQDLLGIRPPVVRDLPLDGRVDGFDKVSAALPLSSAHAAGYLKIAEETLARFPLVNPENGRPPPTRLLAFPSEQSKGHILELADGWKVSFNTDTTSGPVRAGGSAWAARVPGVHRLRLSVYGYQTDKPLPFGIYVGLTGGNPQILELGKVLEAPPGKPAVLEAEVYLRTRRDSELPDNDEFRLIPFGLGVQVPKNAQASNCKGPGLAVQWVDVTEPESPSPGERFLFGDLPPEFRPALTRPGLRVQEIKLSRPEIDAVVRKTFARVGARMFRRDLTSGELTAMMATYNRKVDAGVGVKTILLDEFTSMMISPDFLCLIEKPGPLNNFALAARLSYFLWNSAPDEELLDVARKGKLTTPAVLRQQTDRLLKDARAQRFVKDFVDQWLGLWGIDNTTPDKDVYPEYDDLLKISSTLETQATFRNMLDKNLSATDFVAPKWAMVNGPLAKMYGIPGVEGFTHREVKLPANSPFGGVWTQAATMKVTANGTLTSPVKRGVWVAERLLGISIPPPPPNIEPIDPDTRGAKTLREQLALHRGTGSCAACHAKFDPYGFALESFDVIGNFRTQYRVADRGSGKWKNGLPVDCSGVTPDGKTFASIRELRAALAKNPEQLAFGVTRHLLTYATGTPSGPLDRRAIEQIVKQTKSDNYGLRSLVHGVIQSDQFRNK
jgi:mono/diheme cytochrome c family protein